MEHEELEGEIAALRDRLSRLSEASLHINESLDFETVLQGVLDSARSLSGARYGVITLLDDAGRIQGFLYLGRANLSQSILQDAKVDSAWLDGATLTDATFLRADLSQARLVRADLSDAEFLDANLTGATFSDANLSGARFSHGGHQAAKGLTQAQLDQARADPDNPPNLLNVLDAETGEQLVWRGKPQCHQA